MDIIDFNNYLVKGLYKADPTVVLNDIAINKCYKFFNLLQEYNSKFNLTGLHNAEKIIEKHFIESLLLTKYILQTNNTYSNNLSFTKILKLADIGTGGGFPGIPIKIAMPHVSVSLVESIRKKIYFLEQVKFNLQLESLDIFHNRAEVLGQNKIYRETYDFVLSRAVGVLSLLIELSFPLLKPGGLAIFLKGQDIQTEIDNANMALEKLFGKIIEIKIYSLPYSNQSGKIVILEKQNKTPINYPRKGNKLGIF